MRFAPVTISGLLFLAIADNACAQTSVPKEPLKKSPPANNDLFGVALTTPLPLLYLEQESVRAELKLTKEQIGKLEIIEKSWQAMATTQSPDGGTERRDLLGGLTKQIDKAINAEQKARLNQIILRHQERQNGLPAVLATIAMELKLSEKQQEEFDRLRIQRADIVLEHLTSGERASAIRKKVHDSNLEYVERVGLLLDKEQQAKLKLLLGEPFAGEIRLREPTFVQSRTLANPIYLTSLFSYCSIESHFLISEPVQRELKMSNDQIRRAKEFHIEWSTQIEKGAKEKEDPIATIQNLHPLVRDNLSDILSDAQRFRFRQIMLQHRAQVSGLAAACGYKDVVDLLKITPEQVKSLRDGERVQSVLLFEQQKQLDALLGPPFAGEVMINHPLFVDRSSAKIQKAAIQGGRPILADGRPVNENLRTFAGHMLDQSKRLRLTPEQESRLRELAEDTPTIRQLLHKELSNLPPPTVHGSARTMLPEVRAAEQLRKSIFDQCFDVLDKQQQSRFGAELKDTYKAKY